MELFKEIMKYLPEMRRHVDELFARDPKFYFSDKGQQIIKAEMHSWIEKTYLDEHGVLYRLFQKAGIVRKKIMIYKMLEWHLLDWNMNRKR